MPFTWHIAVTIITWDLSGFIWESIFYNVLLLLLLHACFDAKNMSQTVSHYLIIVWATKIKIYEENPSTSFVIDAYKILVIITHSKRWRQWYFHTPAATIFLRASEIYQVKEIDSQRSIHESCFADNFLWLHLTTIWYILCEVIF